jgi:hypothetical protein
MSNETSTEQPTNPEIKHGQGVLQRVEQRKQELDARLTKLKAMPAAEREHSGAGAIEQALAAVAGLLTGDLAEIHEPTATQLNQWLETSQNLCDDKLTADTKVDAKAAEAKKAADAKAAVVQAAEALAAEVKKVAEVKAADLKAAEAKTAEEKAAATTN